MLSRDGVFLGPLNARRATPLQLRGTKAGHYGELERVHIAGASHHDESSQPLSFGEGSGRTAEGSEKQEVPVYALVSGAAVGAEPAAREDH